MLVELNCSAVNTVREDAGQLIITLSRSGNLAEFDSVCMYDRYRCRDSQESHLTNTLSARIIVRSRQFGDSAEYYILTCEIYLAKFIAQRNYLIGLFEMQLNFIPHLFAVYVKQVCP